MCFAEEMGRKNELKEKRRTNGRKNAKKMRKANNIW
jgi:hypothetical protein